MKKIHWIFGILALIFAGFYFSFPKVKAAFLWTPEQYTKQHPYILFEISADSGHFVTERSISSKYSDVKLALLANSIPLYAEDRMRVVSDQAGGSGVIYIERAPLITIADGKRTKTVRSWVKDISELLIEQKVPEIGQDDKIVPAQDEVIVNNMTVKITRVQETDIIETKIVPFQVVTKEDNSRYRGEPDVVMQEGKDGKKVLTYHVRREDGVEVTRKLTKTDATAPVEKVISKAAKLKIGQVMTGKASWYSSRYQAASHILPRGTNVRVTNTLNGKSVIIIIQDYMESEDKIIDLHPDIFKQLGALLSQGIQPVKVEEILN